MTYVLVDKLDFNITQTTTGEEAMSPAPAAGMSVGLIAAVLLFFGLVIGGRKK